MFEHEYFDVYPFEEVPLNRDLYLMDEMHVEAYERNMLAAFDGNSQPPPGLIAYAAARRIDGSMQLSWYPNIFTRFHEVAITLPRSAFVACVGSWRYDEKPHIFVKRNWLDNLYARSFSIFGLVDAIGVKQALQNDALSREKLILLRDGIDAIAARNPRISFISFADSLLLKSNWSLGSEGANAAYVPESFVTLFQELQSLYRGILGLGIYCILTQGSNEYYDDAVLHVSAGGNHISLNSLGIPFAQLLEIDKAARAAIRDGTHDPYEIYLDKQFYHSLRFAFGFDKHAEPHGAYILPLTGTDGVYYCMGSQYLLDHLESTGAPASPAGPS